MDGNPRIQKAYESILSHDFERAIEWFERAVAEEPDNAAYHYSLSITYARSNKLAKAAFHAEQACRLNPGARNYALHLNMLKSRQLLQEAEKQLHKDSRQTAEAVKLLEQAVKMDALSVEALLMLGLAYGKQGRFEEAVRVLTEALRLEPHRKEAAELLEKYTNAKGTQSTCQTTNESKLR